MPLRIAWPDRSPFWSRDGAHIGQIGVDHGDGVFLEQVPEALRQVNILAGADGRGAGLLQSVQVCRGRTTAPRLRTSQVVLIQSPRELDKSLDGKVAVVVRGNRYLIADNAAHGFTVVGQPIQCFVGEQRRRELVLAVGVIVTHRDHRADSPMRLAWNQ